MRADAVELQLMTVVLERAAAHQGERDQALARVIVHELALALKRK